MSGEKTHSVWDDPAWGVEAATVLPQQENIDQAEVTVEEVKPASIRW